MWKKDAQTTEMCLIQNHMLVRFAPTETLLNLGLTRKSRKKWLLMIQGLETFKGNHISNIILIYYSTLLAAQDADIKLLSELTGARQSAQSQHVCPKEGLMLQISKAQSPDSALLPQKPTLTLPLLLARKKQVKANAENCWLLLPPRRYSGLVPYNNPKQQIRNNKNKML